MPAAEPPVDGADAGVFHLADWSARRGRDRTSAQSTQRTGQDLSPEQQLTQTVEAMFLSRGRTLTDPPTAQAFDIALEVVTLMLDGAHAIDIISADQQRQIDGMLEGMRRHAQYL